MFDISFVDIGCEISTRIIFKLECEVQVSGHILNLYCVRLSDVARFCENYAKLYFDAKHLEKGLKGG